MCTLCDLFYLKNAKDIAVTWPNSPECCGLNGICFKATFLSFDLLKNCTVFWYFSLYENTSFSERVFSIFSKQQLFSELDINKRDDFLMAQGKQITCPMFL